MHSVRIHTLHALYTKLIDGDLGNYCCSAGGDKSSGGRLYSAREEPLKRRAYGSEELRKLRSNEDVFDADLYERKQAEAPWRVLVAKLAQLVSRPVQREPRVDSQYGTGEMMPSRAEKDAREEAEKEQAQAEKEQVQRARDPIRALFEVYEGERNPAGQKEGHGTCTWADGDVYEGEWRADKPEGQGKYTYADLGVYEGAFRAGYREGHGNFAFASGDVYKGEFKAGAYEGQGTYTFADGHVYHEGTWKAGERAIVEVV